MAVFVNCTITDTEGSGYLVLRGSDLSGERPLPPTSNVNWSTSGQTLANLALCPGRRGNAIEVHAERTHPRHRRRCRATCRSAVGPPVRESTTSARRVARSAVRIASAAASGSSRSTDAAALAKLSSAHAVGRDHVDVRVGHLVAGDDHADALAPERARWARPITRVTSNRWATRPGRGVDPVIDLLDRHHERVAVRQRVDRHERDAAARRATRTCPASSPSMIRVKNRRHAPTSRHGRSPPTSSLRAR